MFLNVITYMLEWVAHMTYTQGHTSQHAKKSRQPSKRSYDAIDRMLTFDTYGVFRLLNHLKRDDVPPLNRLRSIREYAPLLGNYIHIEALGGAWFTRFYGVYARGFEQDFEKPLGREVVFVDEGVRRTFHVPEMYFRNSCSELVPLSSATGLLLFDPAMLVLGDNGREVSIPKSTLYRVWPVDVMRKPGGGGRGQTDSNGFPLRHLPVDSDSQQSPSSSRIFSILCNDDFMDGSTGWHGFVLLHDRLPDLHPNDPDDIPTLPGPEFLSARHGWYDRFSLALKEGGITTQAIFFNPGLNGYLIGPDSRQKSNGSP